MSKTTPQMKDTRIRAKRRLTPKLKGTTENILELLKGLSSEEHERRMTNNLLMLHMVLDIEYDFLIHVGKSKHPTNPHLTKAVYICKTLDHMVVSALFMPSLEAQLVWCLCTLCKHLSKLKLETIFLRKHYKMHSGYRIAKYMQVLALAAKLLGYFSEIISQMDKLYDLKDTPFEAAHSTLDDRLECIKIELDTLLSMPKYKDMFPHASIPTSINGKKKEGKRKKGETKEEKKKEGEKK